VNAKIARRLRKTAQLVAYEANLDWVSFKPYYFGRTLEMKPCGKKLYRALKRNYTLYKSPLGENR